jgi:hypothetical protein
VLQHSRLLPMGTCQPSGPLPYQPSDGSGWAWGRSASLRNTELVAQVAPSIDAAEARATRGNRTASFWRCSAEGGPKKRGQNVNGSSGAPVACGHRIGGAGLPTTMRAPWRTSGATASPTTSAQPHHTCAAAISTVITTAAKHELDGIP